MQKHIYLIDCKYFCTVCMYGMLWYFSSHSQSQGLLVHSQWGEEHWFWAEFIATSRVCSRKGSNIACRSVVALVRPNVLARREFCTRRSQIVGIDRLITWGWFGRAGDIMLVCCCCCWLGINSVGFLDESRLMQDQMRSKCYGRVYQVGNIGNWVSASFLVRNLKNDPTIFKKKSNISYIHKY